MTSAVIEKTQLAIILVNLVLCLDFKIY